MVDIVAMFVNQVRLDRALTSIIYKQSESFVDKFIRSFLVPIVALLFFALGISASLAAEKKTLVILQPVNTETVVQNNSLRQTIKPFLRRTGQVALSATLLLAEHIATNNIDATKSGTVAQTELVLSFFPGQEVRVLVDSQSISSDNIYSYSGRQEGDSISTFSITISDGSYLITLQDVKSGLTYRVVGDTVTGIGKVTELDLRQLPPAYDSDPIIPPSK